MKITSEEVVQIKKAIKKCDTMIRSIGIMLADFSTVESEEASNAIADINLQLHESRSQLKRVLSESK